MVRAIGVVKRHVTVAPSALRPGWRRSSSFYPVHPPLGCAPSPDPARPTSTVAEPCGDALELRRAQRGQLPERQAARRRVGTLPRPARPTSTAQSRAASNVGLCRVPARRARCAARPHPGGGAGAVCARPRARARKARWTARPHRRPPLPSPGPVSRAGPDVTRQDQAQPRKIARSGLRTDFPEGDKGRLPGSDLFLPCSQQVSGPAALLLARTFVVSPVPSCAPTFTKVTFSLMRLTLKVTLWARERLPSRCP